MRSTGITPKKKRWWGIVWWLCFLFSTRLIVAYTGIAKHVIMKLVVIVGTHLRMRVHAAHSSPSSSPNRPKPSARVESLRKLQHQPRVQLGGLFWLLGGIWSKESQRRFSFACPVCRCVWSGGERERYAMPFPGRLMMSQMFVVVVVEVGVSVCSNQAVVYEKIGTHYNKFLRTVSKGSSAPCLVEA